MKNKSPFKAALGVWLFAILILVLSCVPEETDFVTEKISFPEKVNFVPMTYDFEGMEYSARKACDYEGCGEVMEVCFKAGQNIDVGKVEIYNDDKYVYVTAHTTGSWYMIETHLKTSTSKSGIGQGSNPAPGQFPHKTDHDPAVQKFTYLIPISETGPEFYVAFHASVVSINEVGVVKQGETAWACGESFMAQGNWATFSEKYTVVECDEPPVVTCWKDETAWSYGNCYNEGGKGNWASYTRYGGELTKAKLMAGKIYEIGEVIFEPIGNDVKITINLFSNGAFQDVDENIKIQGYDVRPSGNPAPGQFNTHKGKATGNTYSVVVPGFRFYGVHVDAKVATPCK